MKILAIDDLEDNLISVSAMLRAYLPDCEVKTARSGMLGLELARTWQPDTILLDIQMPGMDGFQVCQALKNYSATRHIPIIFLTAARTDPASHVRGLELGGDAFLTKPFEPVELTAQVRAMVRIKIAEDALRTEKQSLERAVAERTAALLAETTKLDAIFDASPVAMLVLDDQTTIVRRNAAAAALAVGHLAVATPPVVGRGSSRATSAGEQQPSGTGCQPVRPEPAGSLSHHDPLEPAQHDSAGASPYHRLPNSLVPTHPPRPGDALGCVHCTEDPRGCGYAPDCQLCPLRHGVESVLAGGAAVRGVELSLDLLRDGRPQKVWLRVGAEPILLAGHRHVVVALEDITEGKQAEEALRGHQVELKMHNEELRQAQAELAAAQARYFDLYDLAPVSYVTVSEAGLILETNLTAATLLGVTRSALVQRPLSKFILKEDQDIYYLHRQKLMATGTLQAYELRMVTAEGSPFWAQLTATAALDAAGQPVGRIVLSNITDRRQAEQEREEALAMLKAAIAQSPSGMLIADAPGVTIRWANAAALGIRGETDRPLTGIEVAKHAAHWQTFRPDGTPYPAESLPLSRAVLKGETTRDEEVIIRNAQGESRWVSANAAPVRNRDGVITAGLVIFHDITERKRLEAALAQRLVALTRPLDQPDGITFAELFDLATIQRIQDEFAAATGVASIITQPDGTPITRPSNFCRLCQDIIRCTEAGRRNCFHSDALLGRHHPDGPLIQPCLSGGLWDAGASITIGDRHIANWLIGQVRDATQSEEKILAYARTIGADEAAVLAAFREVPAMSRERFQQIAQALFTLANQLSTTAYQNIQQARFISERQQAEAALRESNEQNQLLLDSISDAFFALDDQMVVTYYNHAAEQLLGRAAQAVMGRALFDAFPEAHGSVFETNYRRALETREFLTFEVNFEVPPFSNWYEVRVYPTRQGISVFFQVTTERKRAEAVVQRQQVMLARTEKLTHLGSWEWEIAADRVTWSDEMFRIFQLDPRAGAPRFDAHSTLYHSDDMRRLQHAVAAAVADGTPYELELRAIRQDGATRLCMARGLAEMAPDGRVTRLFGSLQDITERQQAEEALRTSEARFNQLAEQSDAYTWEVDAQGLYTHISRMAETVLGYRPDEMVGRMHFYDLHPESEREAFKAAALAVFARKEKFHNLESGIPTVDGRWVWISTNGLPLLNADGTLRGYWGTDMDITKRKQAEAALRASEARHAKMVAHIGDVIVIIDQAGINRYKSPNLEQWFGWRPEELVGVSTWDNVHPEDVAAAQKFMGTLLATPNATGITECRYRCKDGTYKWIKFTGINLLHDPDIRGMLGNYHDITERRQAKLALSHSHDLLRYVIEHNRSAIAVHDRDLKYVYVSQSYLRAFNLTGQDVIGRHHYEVFPDLPQKWREVHQQALVGIVSSAEADAYERADGSVVWTRWECRPWYAADGSIGGLIIYTEDITKRKQAEAELRLFQELVARSSDAIGMSTPEGRHYYQNTAFDRLFGNIGECPPETMFVDRRVGEQVFSAIKAGREWQGEVQTFRPDRTILDIFLRAYALRDTDGRITAVVGLLTDITERKRTEAALRASEVKYRSLIECSSDAIFCVDERGEYQFTNHLFASTLGQTPEYFVGKTFWDVYPKEHADYRFAVTQRVIRTGASESVEVEVPIAGQSLYFYATANPIRDETGKVVLVLTNATDITKLKEATATVQASLHEKESLLKEIHHRVKNNLQIVSSLLRLQAGQIDNAIAKAALQDMQSRVRSMALIHEHLYRSENLAQVDLSTYLKGLCQQLIRTLAVSPDSVRLQLNLAPLRVDIDQAIPCGLLVNELVSNCLKHGFPEGRTGEVRVGLQLVAGGPEVCLWVADNGAGLPEDFAVKRTKSLGLQLVTDLTRQLGGKLAINPAHRALGQPAATEAMPAEPGAGPGAVFELTFTPEASHRPPPVPAPPAG